MCDIYILEVIIKNFHIHISNLTVLFKADVCNSLMLKNNHKQTVINDKSYMKFQKIFSCCKNEQPSV